MTTQRHNGARSAARDIAEALLASARAQVGVARENDWTAVMALADERDDLLRGLEAALAAEQPGDAERAAIVQVLDEVQHLDDELMACVARETERLAAEMRAAQAGKCAATAYGRPTTVARSTLFNHYG